MIAVALGARHEEGGTLRVALALVIPLAAALLQTTVVPFISVGGARPNLPFLVAGSWSVAAGAGEGAWWAVIRGVPADPRSGGAPRACLASLPVRLPRAPRRARTA